MPPLFEDRLAHFHGFLLAKGEGPPMVDCVGLGIEYL